MTPAPLGTGREDEAIRARTEEFVTAWNRHDARAMAAVFAEDADLVNPFGRTATSRAEIEKLFSDEHAGSFKTTHFSMRPENLRHPAPDVAVGNYGFEVSGARDPQGKEITLRGHLTLIFRNGGDGWRVVAGRPMIPVTARP